MANRMAAFSAQSPSAHSPGATRGELRTNSRVGLDGAELRAFRLSSARLAKLVAPIREEPCSATRNTGRLTALGRLLLNPLAPGDPLVRVRRDHPWDLQLPADLPGLALPADQLVLEDRASPNNLPQ
jgi:hypothetical protein